MGQKKIVVEMNKKLARRFEETCNAAGLDMEEAINIFAQKMVNEKGMPFEIREEDFPGHVSTSEKIWTAVKRAALFAGAAAGLSAVLLVAAKKQEEKREKRFW